MNELTKIFNLLSPARQDKVLNLARALLQEQENELATGTGEKTTRRGPGRPKGRKGSSYETTKTVKNAAGKKYRYRVHVTVDPNGKRREKYLGRIDK